MIKLKNILMEQGPESKASDAVLGNPGKRVDVNPSNLEVYDINGDLLPTVPADLNQNLRTQNYREVTVTPKYYFQTKNMGETSYVKYDVKTGQLTDNKTGEELVKLNPGLPARQVYLWLRRNHFGKRDDRFQRESVNEAYAWERKADGSLPTLKDVQEAYDAKGVDEAAKTDDINIPMVWELSKKLGLKYSKPMGPDQIFFHYGDKASLAKQKIWMDITNNKPMTITVQDERDEKVFPASTPIDKIVNYVKGSVNYKKNLSSEPKDIKTENADKDYDGDGKIESGSEEYLGSRDKAIKSAMKEEEDVCESCGKPKDECECEGHDHSEDTDESILNMGSLEETFWSRVKGNLHGHEYILKETFKK